MTQRNISHTLRSGFHYEELWGLWECAKWLFDSDLYESISFQKAPDELENGLFHLDDIVIQTQSGQYILHQVKHKEHPESNPWEFDDLTKRQGKTEKSKPLIQKWAESYKSLRSKSPIQTVSLLTNGMPSDDIKRCLNGSKIMLGEINKHFPQVYGQLIELVERKELEEFFENFDFCFGLPSISQLKKQINEKLFTDLFATKSGVDSLFLFLQSEFRKEYPVQISYEVLVEQCEFDTPRPLNQEFEVPEDFQLFNENLHNDLLDSLESESGGAHIVVGKPGVGKSTYLSKLCGELKERNQIAIRHHYHISPEDPDPQERLHSLRIVEALKSQIKKYPAALGKYSHINSNNIPLHDFLKLLASHCSEQHSSCVIIIDGLDHALRYSDDRELGSFLKEVCHPQPGLWIVLGMQEVAKSHLPQVIYDTCPEKNWIHIEGLDRWGTEELIIQNSIGLSLPEESLQRDSVLASLWRVTKGNPLILRYTLRRLKTNVGSSVISDYAVDRLVPYDGEIDNYYSSLWQGMDSLNHTMLIVIHIIGEPLTSKQFSEMYRSLAPDARVLENAYDQIEHLCKIRNRRITFFHSSFQSFIEHTKDLREQHDAVITRLLNWLSKSKDEFLRWALVPILKCEIGDSSIIHSLDREWLINAIYNAYPRRAINRLLRLATKSAFTQKNYPLTFHFETLSQYYSQFADYDETLADEVWNAACISNGTPAETIYIEELSTNQLVALMHIAKRQGVIDELYDDAVQHLSKQHEYHRFQRKSDYNQSPPELPTATIQLKSLDTQNEPAQTLAYIRQFADLGWEADLIAIYVKELHKNGLRKAAIELLKLDLNSDERDSAYRESLLFEIAENRKDHFTPNLLKTHPSTLPIASIYLLLRGIAIESSPALPDYSQFPFDIPDYETKSRPSRANLFSDAFVTGLVLNLQENEQAVRNWIEGSRKHWALNMTASLLKVSRVYASAIRTGHSIELDELWTTMATVTPLRWIEDRNCFEWQHGFTDALYKILDVIIAIKRFRGENVEIDVDCFSKLIPSAYMSASKLTQYCLERDVKLISDSSLLRYFDDQIQQTPNTVDELPSRARQYLDLCKLAIIHHNDEYRNNLLQLAVANTIAYGSHKDPYLYNLIDSLDACRSLDLPRFSELVRTIAPHVEHVTEFTDQSDMHGVVASYAELLAHSNPLLLRRFYKHAAKREFYENAQKMFSLIIGTLDFTNPFARALASTALDNESLPELRRICNDDVNATQSLEHIEGQFGNITFPKSIYSESEPEKTEETHDVANIPPNELKSFLTEHIRNYKQAGFISSWAAYWLQPDNPEEADGYDVLKSLIPQSGLEHAEAEILDAIIPSELRRNKNIAFEYLIWALANDSSWSTNFTSGSRAMNRWQLVQKEFPDRYDEVFHLGIKRSGLKFGSERYSFPIPRSISYFTLFGESALVEQVLVNAVEHLVGLMGDLKLPESPWLDSTNCDVIDLLLQRLEWPSPLVKERAASAISSLLENHETRSSILEKLREWLSLNNLESTSQYGILALAKASTSSPYTSIEFAQIVQSLKHTNMVIDELLFEIKTNSSISEKIEPRWRSVPIPPSDFEPSEFFKKYVGAYLAQIYLDYVNEIESHSVSRFTERWASESTRLLNSMKLTEAHGQVSEFLGRKFDFRLACASTRISEVYRTAFIRTVQQMYLEEQIPWEFCRYYTLSTCPMDLSYWEINCVSRPSWWPTQTKHSTSSDSASKIVTFDYQSAIDEIIGGQTGDRILALQGPVITVNEGTSPKTGLTIMAFGYKLWGSILPSDDEIAESVLYTRVVLPSISNSKRPLNLFSDSANLHRQEIKPIVLGDLEITPLVGTVEPHPKITWQWWRGRNPFYVLSHSTFENMNLAQSDSGIQHFQESRVIANSSDWIDGVRERERDTAEIRHGTFLTVNKDTFESTLDSKGLRYGFVVQIRTQVSDSNYEESKRLTSNTVHNLSRIITAS